MSNKVADLYNIIIENVVNETRNDFEESGEDPSVLEKLRDAWRKRLKDMHVTREPLWENPEPQHPTTSLQHSGLDMNMDLSGMGPIPTPQSTMNPVNPIASATGNPNQGYGFQRSDMMPLGMNQPLQRGTPSTATNTGSAVSSGQSASLNGVTPNGISGVPGMPNIPSGPTAPHSTQLPTVKQEPSLGSVSNQFPPIPGQVPRGPTMGTNMGANPMLTANSAGGGGGIPTPVGLQGLGLPDFSQANTSHQQPHSRMTNATQQTTGYTPLTQFNEGFNPLDSSNPLQPNQRQVDLSPQLQNDIHNAMKNPRVPQTDGTADDELNSDLDDSEDELNSGNEDEDIDQTQIMLCLYEKVHKVKTRWKYILKDGVANINGLDFVFSKGTGESEW